MITGLFLFQLFVTFLTGSIWIFLVVLAGKRFGSKTAGFIGGLPSTAVLSFFFIGFTQSPETASEATTIFPIVYGVTALFLVVYAWQIKKGIFIALSSGLIVWIILSTIIILLDPDNFIIILFCYILILLCVYFLLERILKITSYGRVLTNYTNRQIAFRSLFGGLIIMMAVLFAKLGGPVFGGMFAASLQNPTSPTLVADTILNIAQSDTWQLRHPVGPDAIPFLEWRASMTDEQWVDWNAQSDELWYEAVQESFGLDARIEVK